MSGHVCVLHCYGLDRIYMNHCSCCVSLERPALDLPVSVHPAYCLVVDSATLCELQETALLFFVCVFLL